ncbi:MAG: hydantoinase/oxoprolinase family protein [Proteobacteria bacterium]|nr:hydantoinase/oxoprolinase family protein [Pseudomonadota bacterium]
MRLGIDVGGTNTDAVLVSGNSVVASAKRPTTADVSSGIVNAIQGVLQAARLKPSALSRVTLGTTHFANAFVERNGLLEVAVIRLAGHAAEAIPPMSGWPKDLRQSIMGLSYQLPGGYEFDGRENSPLDEAAIRAAARAIRAKGIQTVAISCVFAPIRRDMEERAAALIREELPGVAITTSGTIGRIGFLERENATIINASLVGIARKIMRSIDDALRKLGILAPCYVTQNDGTVATAQFVSGFPVLTFGSGPTNSMRGAAFLTGLEDAIVMDVGGTTTDIGALVNGFPRESSIAVEIGGIRTNFRMPDILSVGLGGGTRIRLNGTAPALGPDSVGYKLLEDAYLFGGSTLTASDIAVKAGLASFGDVTRVPELPPGMLAEILQRFRQTFEDGLDRLKTSAADIPVVLVGGGSILVPKDLKGASQVMTPEHAAVANAVGAAVAQVGGEVDRIVSYEKHGRDGTLRELERVASEQAVAAGADPKSIRVVDVDETYLAYMPGTHAQVRVKVVGDL